MIFVPVFKDAIRFGTAKRTARWRWLYQTVNIGGYLLLLVPHAQDGGATACPACAIIRPHLLMLLTARAWAEEAFGQHAQKRTR
jgi:hypothetical protein